ncbi:hypothetical protein BC829DRAFT_397711 [Chytridium lagenaria]|nr:hypothetical protein BC829DRAFT_397711 [Chytridium lagenaria]
MDKDNYKECPHKTSTHFSLFHRIRHLGILTIVAFFIMVHIHLPSSLFATTIVASVLVSSCSAQTFSCWPINNTGSLYDFITCLSKHYIPADYIKTRAEFDAKLPVAGLTMLAADMLANGCPTQVPSDVIQDTAVGRNFCVAAETTIDSKSRFTKGWGVFVVPFGAGEREGAGLHLQAPHPIFDGSTDLVAADLFRNVQGFRSLLLATRHRNAYQVDSTCTPNSGYSLTDPTHSDGEPFFNFASAILQYQNATTCSDSNCGILQLHGKGANTCSSDTFFLSAGTGVASVYNNNPTWHVNRMATALLQSKPVGSNWTAGTPASSSCTLTATRNVVGKIVNGISFAQVCSGTVTSSKVTGRFSHIETAQAGREITEEVLGVWRNAFTGIFNGTY